MLPCIFLSHNKADKAFVRRLATDLENQGISFWLDEAEIKVGESLIEKIRDGIDRMDYVAVVLSPDSVASHWVKREIDVAMNLEIIKGNVKVLPILYRQCDLPGFLLGKRYADFTDESNYAASFEDLVTSVGVVFNRNALLPQSKATQLGAAIDKAWARAIPILSHPFHRPFQYIGMTIKDAARATGGIANAVGNIILNSIECDMCLEAEGNFISYVYVDIKQTAPHRQGEEFDSEIILGAISINASELELVCKQTHYHTYYDHRKRLKISVSCLYDGAPLSVAFSSKYYGM